MIFFLAGRNGNDSVINSDNSYCKVMNINENNDNIRIDPIEEDTTDVATNDATNDTQDDIKLIKFYCKRSNSDALSQ